EQAAGAQEVLLGDLTYRLVRDYVDVEEVEPLQLKWKSEPVPAYRLVGVREGSERQQRRDSPMIGRDHELELLSGALKAAMDTRTCRLVTIVGEAGVGKSRLIDEFVLSVEERAHVLRGRCLPYGDGITPGPGNTRSWTTGSRLPAGAVAVARPNNVTATRPASPATAADRIHFLVATPSPPLVAPVTQNAPLVRGAAYRRADGSPYLVSHCRARVLGSPSWPSARTPRSSS
ncbi:MAG: AAA family ATPase, partial [Actinomycetota bacterium]|nr:AAA family ATPase [Actinomycetota bacterium]